ncbi:hypothetical protein J3R82DRAFT_2162 [Butyriboletus roseoflavus]|nr:hypothetical protein J3R82DRAFT_2162 [Butyriboletus roseoflavus]
MCNLEVHNLNKLLLHAIYLEQLGVCYNLQDELQYISDQINNGPIGHEQVLDNYPNYVFHPPYKAIKCLEHELYIKITKYLAQVLKKCSSKRSGNLERRNYYVQYRITYQDHTQIVKHLGYSDLEKILIITLPDKSFLTTDFSERTIALALATLWDTNGRDATEENIYMTE